MRYFVGGLVGVSAATVLGAVTGWWTAAHSASADRQLLWAEWWAIAVSTGMNTAAFWVLVLLPLGLLVAYFSARLGGRT